MDSNPSVSGARTSAVSVSCPMPALPADTIGSLATAPGSAPRAILRISGPLAGSIVESACSGLDGSALHLQGRGQFEVTLEDGHGGQPCRIHWMPGPGSYTREDVVELHLVGHAGLVQEALSQLLSMGIRPALPGEFTRRAFENGRLDLTQAEGVLALVAARNQAELRAASALLVGGLGDRVQHLRAGLEAVRALTEASLDFDESDTGHIPATELGERLAVVLGDLQAASRWESQRTAPLGLQRVVLYGRPNAGKSALYNRLVTAEEGHQAIESDYPGTTRDTKRGEWQLPGGQVCVLEDTAGEDPTAEGVDGEAQRLQQQALEAAHLVLWAVPASEEVPGVRPQTQAPMLVVRTKQDLEAHPADREPW